MTKEFANHNPRYEELVGFFKQLGTNSESVAQPHELIRKPLRDGTIRPSNLLIRACGLHTTRSENQLSGSPNEHHTHDTSLHPLNDSTAILLRDHHTIETTREEAGTQHEVTTHQYYLTHDGWLVSEDRLRENGEYDRLVESMNGSTVGAQDDDCVLESKLATILRTEKQGNTQLWKSIAQKVTF